MSTRTETEFLEEENANLREQLAAALKRLDDLEDWTTMLIQRDEARALVAELRAILLQGGQNAGDVRRWAIAALERAGVKL